MPLGDRDAHRREFHAAMRRLWALPRDQKFDAYTALAEYFGEPPAVEPAVAAQLRRRADALKDLRRAAAWLGLDGQQAPTAPQYDEAQAALGLMPRHRIVAAYERWSIACRELRGDWVPETVNQRALRRATSGRARQHETYLQGVRDAITRKGARSTTAAEYDDYVAAHNGSLTRAQLAAGRLPMVGSAAIRAAFPLLRWDEIVAAAFGEVDPQALMRERAEATAVAAREADGLIGADVIAALLEVRRSVVTDLQRSGKLPVAVARLGPVSAWLATDIWSWLEGEAVPARRQYELQAEVCGSNETAQLLRTTPGYLIAALHRGYRTVPAPAGRVSGARYWWRRRVEAWLAEHGPVGRR
jgi:hypothetical protein